MQYQAYREARERQEFDHFSTKVRENTLLSLDNGI